jgi:hypothetical protein
MKGGATIDHQGGKRHVIRVKKYPAGKLKWGRREKTASIGRKGELSYSIVSLSNRCG